MTKLSKKRSTSAMQ